MSAALLDAPILASERAPIHIGRVALKVRDLDLVSRFYQDAIGLAELDRSDGTARLGAGGVAFLDLVQDKQAALASPREAGLFHTAFLLPTRADLGRWLTHAAATRLSLEGAADHLVSEALYLSDPEGNGIEIYVDRDPSEWRWSDGRVEMANAPVDFDGLARLAGDTRFGGMAPGTRIGHVHLRVGDTGVAETFYAGALGFDVTAKWPGGTFYSTGRYHHHLATNSWQSRGAGRRDPRAAGLSVVDLAVTDRATYDALPEKLERAGTAFEQVGDTIGVTDPFGTQVRLVAV